MHWFARTLISSGDIQRARDILVECLAGVESPEDSMYFDACSVLLVDCLYSKPVLWKLQLKPPTDIFNVWMQVIVLHLC